jgi:hypothetical protein
MLAGTLFEMVIAIKTREHQKVPARFCGTATRNRGTVRRFTLRTAAIEWRSPDDQTGPLEGGVKIQVRMES